jgi:hypothetical protein
MKEWTAAEIIKQIEEIKTADLQEADCLVKKLAGLLNDQSPVIQGLVLASITSLWLVGFRHHGAREKLLAAHIRNVRAWTAYELKASRTS